MHTENRASAPQLAEGEVLQAKVVKEFVYNLNKNKRQKTVRLIPLSVREQKMAHATGVWGGDGLSCLSPSWGGGDPVPPVPPAIATPACEEAEPDVI